jgi:hypothetical protein
MGALGRPAHHEFSDPTHSFESAAIASPAEKQEREFAAARRARARETRREQESTAVEQLRADTQRELHAIRRQAAAQAEAVGEALGVHGDKIVDHIEKLVKQTQSDLFIAIERRFGEIMGRIDAILPDARPRPQPAKDFRFANEYDEAGVIDLPNPLKPRVN